MKKQILFVIDSLQCGGAEKSLVSLLTLFDYEKYEVDLLLFSRKGLYLPLLPKQVNVLDEPEFLQRQQKGIKNLIRNMYFKDLCVRLGASFSLRNPYLNQKIRDVQIIWKWISGRMNCLEKKYDVAIAYSQGMPTYFVAEKVKADKKICWVNTDYKVASYNKDFDIKYYAKFNNIVAVSKACKEVLVRELPDMSSKVRIVYDILSPSIIRSMAESEGFTDKYNGLRILTIGRLVHQKGYEMAIEACHKLKQDGLKFKWYAIGEGDLRGRLEKMIEALGLKETFILLGISENPYPFLKQSDIYVQPSRYEGYGLAVAEARILQKPIVATNFTVVHNQIKDRVNGLIVEMNSGDLYKGIKMLVDDSELRKRICCNHKNEEVGTEEEIFKVYSLIESEAVLDGDLSESKKGEYKCFG